MVEAVCVHTEERGFGGLAASLTAIVCSVENVPGFAMGCSSHGCSPRWDLPAAVVACGTEGDWRGRCCRESL